MSGEPIDPPIGDGRAAARPHDPSEEQVVDPTRSQRRRGGMSRTQWLMLALIVPLVLVGVFVAGRAFRDDSVVPGLQIESADDATEFDWDYVIPAGTAASIAAGETVEIVPAELVVRKGDTIRIINQDDTDHIVGVFFVGAGETLTQRFQSVGVLEGECSVHSGGAFTLRVEE